MELILECSLVKHFDRIQDYRDARWRRHLLLDILIIALCATLGGAEGWDHIAEFGKAHKKWFSQFLSLESGIPSADTFRRVFERIRPDHFESCFTEWIQSIRLYFENELVSIDGKSIRGSYLDSASKSEGMLHMVSAWSKQNSLILGQVKTHDKSNEITAIPQLLKTLYITNCIVTIDAMGCQRAIAKQIKEQKADYILAVKENQGALHNALKTSFGRAEELGFKSMVYTVHEEVDSGHGRIETRKCTVLPMMYLHQFKEKWVGLSSLVRVQRERVTKLTGEIATETMYYISSLQPEAALISSSIRGHWEIENKVHWVLDVVFREDDSRIRDRNSAQNASILKRMSINMLKKETSKKTSLKIKRMTAGWNPEYLEKILSAN